MLKGNQEHEPRRRRWPLTWTGTSLLLIAIGLIAALSATAAALLSNVR